MLRQCRESVLAQQIGADHFLIAGFPDDAISDWKAKHVVLRQSHADNGNIRRAVGSFIQL